MTRGRRPALHGRGALSGGEVPLPGAGKYHWPASHLVRGIVLATESAANHATVAHVRVERYCAAARATLKLTKVDPRVDRADR